MAKDTRIVRIDSDTELGQFLETSLERFIGGESDNVRVTELDPNTIPEDLLR